MDQEARLMGAIEEGVNVALQAGVVPFVVFIIATIVMLALFKRVYPALAVGAASALIVFISRAPGVAS